MKPVRVRTALIVGALAAVVLGLVFQLVVNAGSALPRHSWWEAVLLLVAGAALASGGWRIRRYVDSLASRPAGGAADPDDAPQPRVPTTPGVDLPSPENARRTLVLAQAAAVGGAVLAGWYLAQVGVRLSRWNVDSVRSAILLLIVLWVEAMGLSALGFTVQKWCTLPEEHR